MVRSAVQQDALANDVYLTGVSPLMLKKFLNGHFLFLYIITTANACMEFETCRNEFIQQILFYAE